MKSELKPIIHHYSIMLRVMDDIKKLVVRLMLHAQ